MIVVFWLEGAGAAAQSRHAAFGPAALHEALRFAESLRARRCAGEAISHGAIQSELPEAVGPAGVADKGYAHDKRRPDPAVPPGRPARPAK